MVSSGLKCYRAFEFARYVLLALSLLLYSIPSGAQSIGPRKWDKGANTDNFFDPANWDNDQVPADGEDVVLDHQFFLGDYNVVFPAGSAPKTLNSLTINPGSGDSIRVEVPSTNTTALALTLTGVGGKALSIYDKGVFTNASGANGGTIVEIAGTAGTLFIYNGGTYRHYSTSTHASVAENISTAAGTENGNWVFRRSSTTLSLSNRSYPNLILRCPSNQAATNYGGSGSGVLTIRGNLIIASKATFAPTMTGEVRIAGNVVIQGGMRFAPSGTPGTGTLTLNGQTAQTISGPPFGATATSASYLSPGVTLKVNNTAGVTLLAPMIVNGTLELVNGLLNTDGTNLVTLANNATGGSSTSFVNGPVARVATIAGAVVFPVGRIDASGAAYRPLTLNIATLAVPTTFTAVQQEGTFDATNLNGDLKRVSQIRSFQITPAPVPTAGQFLGSITLSFGTDDVVTNPEANSLVIAKNSGSGWESIGHAASTGTFNKGETVAGTLTSTQFTSFSQFALGNTEAAANQNPLPITLTSFTAVRRDVGTFLRWTTATEKDNNRFEVQRSINGKDFKVIDIVPGQRKSSQMTVYTSFDVTAPNTLAYYRLRQVDEDGTASFSPIVAVQPALSETLIFPNPASSYLSFQTRATKVHYRIFNSMSQVVLSGEAAGGREVIDVRSLRDGIYYLELRMEAGCTIHRFEKQP
ncbi:T9SS type A sorting domain-containing protein [Hymenobacter cavernae]|nr:T9SS type A sorting domain-containing protein [Hymenobacter cavernae]